MANLETKIKNTEADGLAYCYLECALQCAEQKLRIDQGVEWINKSIELDDMTDNFRKSNNFYSNLSFRYVEDGMPEMIGFCNQIVRKWRHIKKKYDLQFDIFKSLIPKRSINIF